MKQATMKRIPNKIESVVIRRMIDESPDTSWLGEYSNRPTSEYSIDRAHSLDCSSVALNADKAQTALENARGTVAELQALEPSSDTLEWEALEDAYYQLDGLVDQVKECDCDERGDMERGQSRYFNPCHENYKGIPEEEIRKYCVQDYERMERLNRGDWCFLGIRVEAEISIPSGPGYSTLQTIHSGGLWGIESDSDKSHFAETEANELADLRTQLYALGFSKRAIAIACKAENIQHKDN
jgi:hypothetical protein